ncbi:glycosyltransferase family 2 protein [Chryseobacterium sp.]|uniref:glycosyltransferase family 2 protein n=1 Tax=Chryseobacterium sp. TaxID=1871047 RepID=UPI00289B0169|nr:glycosyltransferase family 2 protein [Chryseobacterium sp.]
MNQINVSIIIVNFNTYSLLIDCINSVYEKTRNVSFEIIVVDNNSTVRDIEGLNEIFPNVKLILSSINNGFGAGNNVGSSFASGKYLFLLNSDTILLNDAISELFAFFEQTKDAGICGGNLYTLDLEPTISFELRRPGLFIYTINFLQEIFYKKLFNKIISFSYRSNPQLIRGYISGADFFVRKDFFEKVGKFDENFFMYYEEVDLTKRINDLGFYSYIVPSAKIIHLEGGSQKKESANKLKWMKESCSYYFKKHNKFGYRILEVEKATINAVINFFKKSK